MNEKKIATVVVTYNRLGYLKQVVAALKKQSYPTDIIIVNNGSTDGTEEYLKKEDGLTVIHQANVGGSGGFHRGMKYVVEKGGYDYVWVMDDDAIPRHKALEELMKYTNLEGVVALTSTVYNRKGEIDLNHRSRISTDYRHHFYSVGKDEYKKEYFPIDIFSYVGTLIKVDILKQAGLPIKNYFIFYDDTEHALRVGKCGKIYNISNSIIDHQAIDSSPERMKAHWKIPFQYRNKLHCYRTHFPGLCYHYHYLQTVAKGLVAFVYGRKEYAKQILTALGQLRNFKVEQ